MTSREDEAVSRWEAIVHTAVDGIVVIDADGRIEAFNPAAERLFGYSEAEVLGQNVRLLMPEPHASYHDEYIRNYLASGTAKVIGKGREVTARRRDGTTFPIHLSVGELVIDGEHKFTGIVHDLSERVRMEQQLREQTALAHLGEMAAVVAHEVKNPLAAIRAAVQTLDRLVPADSTGRQIVPQIVNRIDALSDLMHELLLFARPPRPRRALTRLNDVVNSTADFLTSDPDFAGVNVAITGDTVPVAIDAELLKIVVLNVMMNSAQAMAGNGRIDVRIRTEGGEAVVEIEDTGPGMPAEVRDKVFTPFFTTKRRGTGLGLPTAKRLVEAHGGTILLDCPPGGGTRVTVRVAVTQGEQPASPSSESAYTR